MFVCFLKFTNCANSPTTLGQRRRSPGSKGSLTFEDAGNRTDEDSGNKFIRVPGSLCPTIANVVTDECVYFCVVGCVHHGIGILISAK